MEPDGPAGKLVQKFVHHMAGLSGAGLFFHGLFFPDPVAFFVPYRRLFQPLDAEKRDAALPFYGEDPGAGVGRTAFPGAVHGASAGALCAAVGGVWEGVRVWPMLPQTVTAEKCQNLNFISYIL